MRAVLKGCKKQRVEVEIFETVVVQPQLIDDGREPDEDVRAAAEIELEARHKRQRGHRAANHRAALEHTHSVPRLCRVGRRDERVVPRTDENDVVHKRVIVRRSNYARAVTDLRACSNY